tara:strand:- start:348 stop:938 length:591 start_codon:yes stop_codon:yes gene_type:complete
MSKTTIPTGGLADSAVTTAKITDATIASGDLADDAVTAAKIADAVGLGKILQITSGTTTTDTAMTSTTFADTSLSASITPSATGSKVLVLVNQVFRTDRTSASTINAGLQLLRGSSVIYSPQQSGGGGRNFGLNATGTSFLDLNMIYSFQFLDSPSTTSSTTYKTQQAVSEASANMTAVSQESDAPSFMYLIEVGA